MESQNDHQSILDKVKGGLSVIILRVKASELFNNPNPSPEDIKRACCVIDILNNRMACNGEITNFETPVYAKSWVIWHGMLQEEVESELYDIALDFVLIKKPSSKIFNKVIYYQDDGTVMAKTKNSAKPKQREPYEITFTLIKGETHKTYVLDPWVLLK
jgi:hypothetical protein